MPKKIIWNSLNQPVEVNMNENAYQAYCAAWCVCFDPHKDHFDYEMIGMANGIVFG